MELGAIHGGRRLGAHIHEPWMGLSNTQLHLQVLSPVPCIIPVVPSAEGRRPPRPGAIGAAPLSVAPGPRSVAHNWRRTGACS